MITVKEVKDKNVIEKITTNTLKRLNRVEPHKIPLEAYQNTKMPFFTIKYDDVNIGYAILIIHNEYVAELQEMWSLDCFKFSSYGEHIAKIKEVSRRVGGFCNDYCNSRGMNLLYKHASDIPFSFSKCSMIKSR